MEVGDGSYESKKRKRNLNTTAEDQCYFAALEKLEKIYKKIILCLAKPSYNLGLGSYNVRPKNRVILCHLLRKLFRQHNWTDASGVLSILLKGTCKDIRSSMNRFKYLVLMELIKHLEAEHANLTVVSSIFDTWMTRVGINLSNKRKRNKSANEDGFVVRLESILFRMMQGNIEDERQNARSLMQESEFEGHPMFSTIIGLIFSQLCYSSFPGSVQWNDSDQIHSPIYTDMSVSHPDMLASTIRCEVRGSEGHNALFNDESESYIHYGSETSVMNGKEMVVTAYSDLKKEVVPMEVDVIPQSDVPQDFQPQGFYVFSTENEVSDNNDGGHAYFTCSLSALKSLDSWLLPLRTENWEVEWVIQDYEYNHAMRCLQAAVNSTPPVLAALIPLIQLLLIGGKYKEALDELEKFCGNSNASLPNRLRAHLLESIDHKNSVVQSTCFEDTLRSDPACRQSLDKLVSLHRNGSYCSESLIEMIALHLEAVFGDYKIWREFALCFLKVSQYEEDSMSAYLHGNEGEKVQGFSVRYKKIPKLFICGKSGRAWRFRCRWWLARHFSKKLLASEISSGNFEVLTWKAACAAHLYGPEIDYVVKAYSHLNKENTKDLFLFLEMHIRNFVGIISYFKRTTN